MKHVVQWFFLALMVLETAGCGTMVAHSIVRAPNRYPEWLAASEAPVILAFDPKLLTNFPAQYVDVGPPTARLCYRVIEPADYRFQMTSTNWLADGRKNFQFDIRATLPKATNGPARIPRGTVILLHGYCLAQFSMLPWALYLAQEGWRCVLVDLRGHGKSTGPQIYFGTRETNDLSELLDDLSHKGEVQGPVSVMGESYGAALALRWKTVEPRVQSVVAIAPYASLSNAVMNIADDYASWVPKWIIRSGIKQLPVVLQVAPGELDTTTVLKRKQVAALFVTGSEDTIAPAQEVALLRSLALPESRLIVVPGATHEALTYFFGDLRGSVLEWLAKPD